MASEIKDACTRVDKYQRCALQASADTDTEDGIHTAFDQDSLGPLPSPTPRIRSW
jgi:hypothetical protein